MLMMKSVPALMVSLLLVACAVSQKTQQSGLDSVQQSIAAGTSEITIFSINDFHGNLQSDKPVPYLAPVASIEHGHDHGEATTSPAGGYAYLATLLKQRRLAAPASIFVGAGDLMGASPIGSALLKDQPVIEAFNQMGLSVTSVGNHEFDAGRADLLSKIKGECPLSGCPFPGFSGAKYEYIAANVIDTQTAQSWLRPYVIRQVGDVKIAFIGAVTSDTPNLVAGDGVKGLQFEDEATAINRYVPEIKQQGVSAIVVLIHEGGNYKGDANDTSYACNGLEGPIIDISKKLDKAISLVVSGHTHQGYTCKIDGRLVVQARSYGAYLTETKLTIDRGSKQVIASSATNYLVDQQKLKPDPQARQLVDKVAALTTEIRLRPVTTLAAPLTRESAKGIFDSSLGNVIADAQLKYAQNSGPADIAFMNSGGIRSDLPSGAETKSVAVTFGDIYASQPFGNNLVRMSLSGEQIMAVLQQQWQGREADNPKKLFVSSSFSYRWSAALPLPQRVQNVLIHGKPLELAKIYKVVVNSFLADGGDAFTMFKQGQDRQLAGRDLDALETYVRAEGGKLATVATDRVKRSE